MTRGKASCVPVKLDTQVSGNTVKVRLSSLHAGRRLF
jgi:hypothetical protein